MPPMKKVEANDATTPGCILRLGKANNVVTWNEELKSTVEAINGSTANFLQTNARYTQPLVVEADYIPEIEEAHQLFQQAYKRSSARGHTKVEDEQSRNKIVMSRRSGPSCGGRCPPSPRAKCKSAMDTKWHCSNGIVYGCGSSFAGPT